MKKLLFLLCIVCLFSCEKKERKEVRSIDIENNNREVLKIDLPKPMFEGTKKNLKGKIRPLITNRKILVPLGLTNLALNKQVISSDEEPIIGELEYVTDGDKEGTDGSFVELGPGQQWVQIDLKKEYNIYAVICWHYHREGRIYNDVMVKISNDKDMIEGTVIFNNDKDNSSGMGIGKDYSYLDDYKGEVLGPVELNQNTGEYKGNPIKGRYVRLYSNGNIYTDLNHYIEVEIYGK